MLRLAAGAAGAWLLATSALAAPLDVQTYRCIRDGELRTITLRIHDDARPPACDVRYQKLTELLDHDEVLWRGTNGLGYCREKALELQTKFTRWGWQCDGEDDGVSALSPNARTSRAPAVPATNGSSSGAGSVDDLPETAPPLDEAVAGLDEDADVGPQFAIEAGAALLRRHMERAFGGGHVQVSDALSATGDLNGDGRLETIAGYLVAPRGGGIACVLGVFVQDDRLGYRAEALRRLAPLRWPRSVRIEEGRVRVTEVSLTGAPTTHSQWSLVDGRLVRLPSP